MARPTFGKHWKFRRLCHILQEPLPHVRGYMELLWEVAYETGEAVIGDEVDVELAAHYPGEPGRFAAAVEKVRLIDRLEDGRLAVHDLWDHAPDYVRKRWARERDRKLSYAPRDRPLTAEWRKELDLGGHCPPKCDTRQTKGDLGKTPSPTPSPTPKEEPPLPPKGGLGESAQRGKVSKKPRPKPVEWDGTLPPALDVPEFRAVWESWEEDRKTRGKALTAEARRLGLKRCESWGVEAAVASIEASIIGGYQGLFEPKPVASPHANGNGTPDYWAQTNAIIAEAEAKHAGRRK